MSAIHYDNLAEADAGFVSHMNACAVCSSDSFTRCWMMRDIINEMLRHKLFSDDDLDYPKGDFFSRRIPTEQELIDNDEIPWLIMCQKAKKIIDENKKKM